MTSRAMMPIYEREAVAREIENLVTTEKSQERVASLLNVSQQAVSRAVNHRAVGPHLARAVADYLGMSVNELVEKHRLTPESGPMSSFDIAVAYLEDTIGPEAIRRVKARIGGRQLRPMEWGRELIAEQQALLADRATLGTPTQ